MEIDVTFTPKELACLNLKGRVAVVIDVIRASTTIIQGIANGCASFLPVLSIAAARRRAHQIRQPTCLLGGERDGQPIPGFHLGNSPGEYLPEQVKGKHIVFTTSNGTAAILAAKGAEEVLISAFVNLEAVARYLARGAADVTLAAAGRGGRPVLDDVVCAGMLAARIQALRGNGCSLTDSAGIARHASASYYGRLPQLLAEAASGKALRRIGYHRDLEFCGQLNILDVMPRLVGEQVVG